MLGKNATIDRRETRDVGGEVENEEWSDEDKKVSGKTECVRFFGDGHVH
jgi:hypothetical protein